MFIPRVVDEHVEAPEAIDRPANQGVDRRLVGHVGFDGHRLSAERGQLGDRAPALLGVAARDHHRRPGSRETAGHAQADAAVPARHHTATRPFSSPSATLAPPLGSRARSARSIDRPRSLPGPGQRRKRHGRCGRGTLIGLVEPAWSGSSHARVGPGGAGGARPARPEWDPPQLLVARRATGGADAGGGGRAGRAPPATGPAGVAREAWCSATPSADQCATYRRAWMNSAQATRCSRKKNPSMTVAASRLPARMVHHGTASSSTSARMATSAREEDLEAAEEHEEREEQPRIAIGQREPAPRSPARRRRTRPRG